VRQNHNCLYFALLYAQGQEAYQYKSLENYYRGAEEQYQSLNVELPTVLRQTDAIDVATRRQQMCIVELALLWAARKNHEYMQTATTVHAHVTTLM